LLSWKPIYCDNPKMKGLTTDGAWVEYMAACVALSAPMLTRIADTKSQGCSIHCEPSRFYRFPQGRLPHVSGISIYGGIKRAEVPIGGSLAIVGIGGLGHIGIQVAKAMVSLGSIKTERLLLIDSMANCWGSSGVQSRRRRCQAGWSRSRRVIQTQARPRHPGHTIAIRSDQQDHQSDSGILPRGRCYHPSNRRPSRL
jgi:hypothetical protein